MTEYPSLQDSWPRHPEKDHRKAIAAAAGFPRAKVYTAVGLATPGRPFTDDLPDGVVPLDRDERTAVIGVIKVLVGRHLTGDQEDEPAGEEGTGGGRAAIVAELDPNAPARPPAEDTPDQLPKAARRATPADRARRAAHDQHAE